MSARTVPPFTVGLSRVQKRTLPPTPCIAEPLPESTRSPSSSVDFASRSHGLSKNAVNESEPGRDVLSRTTMTSSASEANASRVNVAPPTEYSVLATASSSDSDRL